MTVRAIKPEEYFIEKEPYYEPVADELMVFTAAYKNQLPILLKGPTGCGKTRFMEHMAWRLQRPLITVSCHDDLTASDLVGRYLVTGGETVWVDGPLARAVRSGATCSTIAFGSFGDNMFTGMKATPMGLQAASMLLGGSSSLKRVALNADEEQFKAAAMDALHLANKRFVDTIKADAS